MLTFFFFFLGTILSVLQKSRLANRAKIVDAQNVEIDGWMIYLGRVIYSWGLGVLRIKSCFEARGLKSEVELT